MRKLTIISVHGFMGSHESFNDFPSHLQQTLKKNFTISSLIFSYKTKGSNSQSVSKLANFILANPPAKDSNLLLIAHSMGGLLCVDALRLISLENLVWKELLNLVGVISFDSPFFGQSKIKVAKSLFTTSESSKPNNELIDGLKATQFPSLVDQSKTNYLFQKNTATCGLQSQQISPPSLVKEETQTQHLLNRKQSFLNNMFDETKKFPSIQDILDHTDQKNSSQSTLLFSSETATTVYSYFKTGLNVFLDGYLKYKDSSRYEIHEKILTTVNEHVSFLEPIFFANLEEMNARLDFIIGLDVLFKSFYLLLSQNADSIEKTNRTFIHVPTDEKYLRHFESMDSPCVDVVDAHQFIFDPNNIEYVKTIHNTGDLIEHYFNNKNERK